MSLDSCLSDIIIHIVGQIQDFLIIVTVYSNGKKSSNTS